jgi:hypothetical protein
MKKTMTVLVGAFMLALLAFAGIAQGSERNPAESSSHVQELTAMNNRYQGQVKLHAASRGSYSSHLEDLTAMNNRYQGQVKLHAASRGSYSSHLEDLTALKDYRNESPYDAARSVTAPVNPRAGRLSIYPYDAPFFPSAARRPSTFASNTLAAGRCPCNRDLPLSAVTATLPAGGDSVVSSPAGHGVNWGDAAAGAASTAGLALILIAGTWVLRRRDRNLETRRRLARSLERMAVPERPFVGRGPRYLVQPSVAMACAPSLQAIATALREEALEFDADGLRAVRTFITDGQSPFFGRDATKAQREAARLQQIVVEAETAVADREHVPVAA